MGVYLQNLDNIFFGGGGGEISVKGAFPGGQFIKVVQSSIESELK